jgi:hypothetical protein
MQLDPQRGDDHSEALLTSMTCFTIRAPRLSARECSLLSTR